MFLKKYIVWVSLFFGFAGASLAQTSEQNELGLSVDLTKPLTLTNYIHNTFAQTYGRSSAHQHSVPT